MFKKIITVLSYLLTSLGMQSASAGEPMTKQQIPRGILPTHVTEELVVLSKVAPYLRNTYEIKLAVYMAKSKRLQFILAVPLETKIEPSISSLILKYDGKIEKVKLDDYSVYFGHAKADGNENGWVLGNASALTSLTKSFHSTWLQDHLKVGATFSKKELNNLEKELFQEKIIAVNVDEENVRDALLVLIQDAKKDDGIIFIQ
jgi:hypothetical protein